VRKIKLWTLETFVWQQEQFNIELGKMHSNDRRRYARPYSSNEQMNAKYLAATLTALLVIFGWNLFLTQRDAKLFEQYSQPIAQQK